VTTPLIPRSFLFGEPDRLNPELSPDGRTLAVLAPVAGLLGLVTEAVDDAVARAEGRSVIGPQPVSTGAGSGVCGHRWTADGRSLLWLHDHDGDEQHHVWCADLGTGGPPRDLTPIPGVRARILGRPLGQPRHVRVAMNVDDSARPDVYQVDVDTGEQHLLHRNDGFVGWLADDSGTVRGVIVPAAGGIALHRMDGVDVAARAALRIGGEDAANTWVAGVESTSRVVLRTPLDHDTARLVGVDLRSGAVRVLHADRRYDVDLLQSHPRTGRPQFAGVQGDRLRWHRLVAGRSVDVPVLNRRDADVRRCGATADDRRWLLSVMRDDAPVTYELYDRSTAEVVPLGSYQPQLSDRLATTEPFALSARDGLRLTGYRTFPPGAPRRALPTVLVVHSGPWSRDTWGFEPVVQWLANRGYLAVQVNFRGSLGFGRQFLDAGDREWGGAMQADLFDTIEHLVAAGWVDPRRVGVFGESYGGYAALLAALLAPQSISCAVALSAPTNLLNLVGSIPAHWRGQRSMLYRRVGHPVRDRELLWSRSPIAHGDHLTVPVLIAYGANDPRISRTDTEAFLKVTGQAPTPPTSLCFPDEGHTLVRGDNRLAFAAAAERFFADHLGGRCEPVPRRE
jgi:dipeptidyl aminopeptidase/acylaminoacyl peptidase